MSKLNDRVVEYLKKVGNKGATLPAIAEDVGASVDDVDNELTIARDNWLVLYEDTEEYKQGILKDWETYRLEMKWFYAPPIREKERKRWLDEYHAGHKSFNGDPF